MRACDWFALAKPRITIMVGAATAAAFAIAAGTGTEGLALASVVIGAMLASAGTAALNQWLERTSDARMRRTAQRPLPAGRVRPGVALAVGLTWAVGGVAWLAWSVNALAAWLTFATVATYLVAYTPLKRHSAWCVLVGAVPGALPVLIGWAGARGGLDPMAWWLFALVLVWQVPHVAALATVHHHDYANVGWRMQPLGGPGAAVLLPGVVVSVVVLLAVSLVPIALGLTGLTYGAMAVALGLGFGLSAVRFAMRPGLREARAAFRSSVLYLPMLLGAMVLCSVLG